MLADPRPTSPRWIIIGATDDGWYGAIEVASDGSLGDETRVSLRDLPGFVTRRESEFAPRWVWHDTAEIYPGLVAAGTRVDRCHDLRLCHQILRNSAFVTLRDELEHANAWDVQPEHGVELQEAPAEATLFDLDVSVRRVREGAPDSLTEAVLEFERQRGALASAQSAHRLSLLLAAESAGALIAVELAAAGVPWDVEEHDRILATALGERPPAGRKPARLVAVGEEVRLALGDPIANLDSPPKLVQALRAAGIEVSSTSRWVLEEHDHPAIEPLLHYKKLARLLSANGWVWLDEWVRDGRYRPVYIPGGVVTGRWASSGGGALQLPRQLRTALRADPGWVLVSADVSQLEPRVLAAMSGDRAMAAAGAGADLYAGIVASGAVESRQDAKIAMLGAMYGATTGDSGRLMPRLRRAFPTAMAFVDNAARIGEQGGIVSTWLGRSSPAPNAEWRDVQAAATLPGATRRDEDLARRRAREWGRFTRNFVVQGTAAEWALAWMADLRQRLAAFEPISQQHAATPSGPVFATRPHLAFFLHDEVIVHAPREHAEAVAEAVEKSAAAAGKLLFRGAPVDFRLDLHISERATKH